MKDYVSGNEFEQKHEGHFFENEKSFMKFIDNLDPLDEVVDVKRNMNWNEVERNCLNCNKKFLATHPALMYCEEHRS